MAVVNRPIDPLVRLVIADVHGTLVTQKKVLTARAAEAVRKLLDQIAIIGVDIRHALGQGRGLRQRNGMIRLVAVGVTAELIGKVKTTLKL